MCFFPFLLPISAAVRRAWLSASLPPEVKYISRGSAPMTAAIRSRASSSASLARCPWVYRLEGLPQVSCIKAVMVCIAASLIFVVAALSAYITVKFSFRSVFAVIIKPFTYYVNRYLYRFPLDLPIYLAV